jgi:microcystin-dependent protein
MQQHAPVPDARACIGRRSIVQSVIVPQQEDFVDPFVAEIRIFPFNFAPKGWAFCDGQLLPISQNTALFSLLGTTYGGNGKSNFALPDLQGRAPMHPGQGPGLSLHDLGETGGSETVTLLESEIPAHSHAVQAVNAPGNVKIPGPAVNLARANGGNVYANPNNLVFLAGEALAPAGGDQPHNNLQPYLTLNFNIAMQGVFPPRT